MSSHSANERGFTLIEMLIAMSLMAAISFSIYRTTTEAFRLREVLMTEGEFHNGVRLAMNLVGRDIELLYSPVLMLPERRPPAGAGAGAGAAGATAEAEAEAARERQELEDLAATGQDRPSQHWGGMISKLGIRPSRFVGTDRGMTLVSASHLRIYKGSKEADLARITYEVKDDRAAREGGTKILVKTSNADAFNMEERRIADAGDFQRVTPLLRGIESIKFEYYDLEREDWVSNWDTESADRRNRYPDQVRITLKVKGAGRLAFEGAYVFRPEMPLHGLNPSF
jgi:prepilin-type N-terminal cleavage/methylation domain-containing protein